ncbi:MAG: UpxY family transcription antiterminator [Desulfococcaceae bacterium]|jgi:transcription elongation factor/antiterminator RfaH|nr:UpxY family transcription antiterminator [Desulfococcaceae bacterium]
MKSDILIPEWYVLHTKSRFENVVGEALLKKSKEIFLPKITVQSRRKDRKKMIRVPLFPGYVFVKTDLEPRAHLDILKTAGAVQLIGDQKGPISVPEETIISLKIMADADETLMTGSRFTAGDRVMVTGGPFAGVIGIFSRYKGLDRIIVNIDLLGQFAAAEVAESDVEKIPELSA